MMSTPTRHPKVSVCVVAYNQEPYIRQCLQSIVDQVTTFDIEIIVGDDCSRDGTAAIIADMAQRHPGLIKPVLQQTNLGGWGNYMTVHGMAAGQFIAHMDGDDYMLPGKLQAQADFLDQHPDHNIVWHRMMVCNEASGLMVEDAIDLERLPAAGFRRADILRFITVGMNSAKMYRATVRDFPHPGFPVLDFFANVEQVGSGYAGFAGSAPLGVYRAGIGVASSGNGTRQLIATTLRYFAARYPAHRRQICCAALMLFLAAAKNRRWQHCRMYIPVLLTGLHPLAPVELVTYRKMFRMFSLPNAIRKEM